MRFHTLPKIYRCNTIYVTHSIFIERLDAINNTATDPTDHLPNTTPLPTITPFSQMPKVSAPLFSPYYHISYIPLFKSIRALKSTGMRRSTKAQRAAAAARQIEQLENVFTVS
jgi:hypothetical protein